MVRLRGVAADEERRRALDEEFVVRTAEDVARELGQMKGVMMKAGQLLSVLADGLPPEAQAALASLYTDVPPMAPSLAAAVIEDELGEAPERLFLDWEPRPTAAASIGQVHRAVLRDGRVVAVKVQYPGAADAVTSDLANAELLYKAFSFLALRGLDAVAVVDELRQRMGDELDYRVEAAAQQAFADRYRGHPFVDIPAVVPEYSSERVLVSEWVEGLDFDEFAAQATPAARQLAAEAMFRFVQGSIHEHHRFNGDPHPGNYRFTLDGAVTFLDFGLVKVLSDAEWSALMPVMDPLLAADALGTTDALVSAGFLPPDHGLDPVAVFRYVSSPYIPFLTETFAFERSWAAETLAGLLDPRGPDADVMKRLDLPAGFVILDRVVWAMSAVLGRLGAEGPWRGILAEYRRPAGDRAGPPGSGLAWPPLEPTGGADADVVGVGQQHPVTDRKVLPGHRDPDAGQVRAGPGVDTEVAFEVADDTAVRHRHHHLRGVADGNALDSLDHPGYELAQ